MKVFSIAMVAGLTVLLGGCGSSNSSSPALTTAYLEAAPANLSPSPSDGNPIQYAILNPTEVPIVQCPHNPSVAGIVICDIKNNVADTICIPFSNLDNYSSNASDYLGPCKN